MIRKAMVITVLLLVLFCLPVFGQSAFQTDFDHFTTGFTLEGAHRSADCASCHVGGVFKGTPKQCASCHSRGGLVRATAMPLDHVQTTNQCQGCHIETWWTPVVRFDHNHVLGSCESCHDGDQAAGKPADHLLTNEPCELCHTPNAWVPAFFDHTGISENCSSCHDGSSATGKGVSHITTKVSCTHTR